MKNIVLYASLIVQVFLGGTATAASPVARVLNGRPVQIESVPFLVSTTKIANFGNGQLGESTCTGSIIAERWILSAGHCDRLSPSGSITVYSGSSVRQLDGTGGIKVKAVHVYPVYQAQYSDFVLYELAQPLSFSARTAPIAVSRDVSELKMKQAIDMMGWAKGAGEPGLAGQPGGEIGENGRLEQMTSSLSAFVKLSQDSVARAFRTSGYGMDAGKPVNAGGQDSDSGAPAVVGSFAGGYRQVGVYTASVAPNLPLNMLFGEVASVRDWIRSITGLEPEHIDGPDIADRNSVYQLDLGRSGLRGYHQASVLLLKESAGQTTVLHGDLPFTENAGKIQIRFDSTAATTVLQALENGNQLHLVVKLYYGGSYYNALSRPIIVNRDLGACPGQSARAGVPCRILYLADSRTEPASIRFGSGMTEVFLAQRASFGMDVATVNPGDLNLHHHLSGKSIADASSALISLSDSRADLLAALNHSSFTDRQPVNIYEIAPALAFNVKKALTRFPDHAAINANFTAAGLFSVIKNPYLVVNSIKNREIVRVTRWVYQNGHYQEAAGGFDNPNFSQQAQNMESVYTAGPVNFHHQEYLGAGADMIPIGFCLRDRRGWNGIEQTGAGLACNAPRSARRSWYGPYSASCYFGGVLGGTASCNFYDGSSGVARFSGDYGLVLGWGAAVDDAVYFARPLSSLIAEYPRGLHFQTVAAGIYFRLTISGMDGVIQNGGFNLLGAGGIISGGGGLDGGFSAF
ncbi:MULTISPECIES: S1 family peptidase [unclassified Undibacterium]|uniref:S1 family peptidase n=1 Tax=unclassified Undibacterium TaxID=2630295 RepID=UPI002AC9EB49|nr:MULTISPECIES: trypsin-like serine protease [unclassified Undibacterium]MEB0139323.1 trypsin-like serine protease [Undibacterium sp. CCC2.1]MEB0172167.1 trypsin-like serine protease [Undibacterium sp. CCC1.1]MEB0176042.1 trypsin-like serine protease [Undibacterium sp. CCC3.4]MEB0215354.1 trypsin-like serine protease [Undibacterium sp. 5I2]WPX43429.1 trypsin-like serine protease [Undibacterium sp. CCC3.4]